LIPPGTGKTVTVIYALQQRAQRRPGQKILVCGPTNKVVQAMLLQARALMPNVPMALVGTGKNLPDELSDVYVPNYAHRLVAPLIAAEKALKELDVMAVNKEIVLALTQQISDQYVVIVARLEKLMNASSVGIASVMKGVSKRGAAYDLSTLQMEVGRCVASYEYSLPKYVATLDDEAASEKAKTVFSRFEIKLTPIQLRERLFEAVNESVGLLQNKAQFLANCVAQSAPIVFSTLGSLATLHKYVSTFPTVFVDEAAQALVLDALQVLRFNPKMCALIGDPKQLPATIVSAKAQRYGYANSLMHSLVNDPRCEMLKTQYRMHQDIERWPSQQYYHGELITATQVLERTSILEKNEMLVPALKRPCLFFNITSGKEQRLATSISNPQEAQAIAKMVGYLIVHCGFAAGQIGVITFYSAQVTLLQAEIAKVLTKEQRQGLTVSTVDGFQGQERDITLISFVRTLMSSIGFLNDERRINVALTRAKFACWIFACFVALDHAAKSDLPSLTRKYESDKSVVTESEDLDCEFYRLFRSHAKAGAVVDEDAMEEVALPTAAEAEQCQPASFMDPRAPC
jgi:hypothetical protein